MRNFTFFLILKIRNYKKRSVIVNYKIQKLSCKIARISQSFLTVITYNIFTTKAKSIFVNFILNVLFAA